MTRFEHPEWLLLAILLIPWGVWVHRRQSPTLFYPHLDRLPHSAGWRLWLAERLQPKLPWLALFALILAAANPQMPDKRTEIPQQGISIMLLLDVSGSMADYDYGHGSEIDSRLDAAKRTAKLFILGGELDGDQFTGRDNDRIGMVSFAVTPRTVCPLTFDHAALVTLLERQGVADELETGTNVGDAIAEGVIRLNDSGPGRKILILLSDGEHNLARTATGEPLMPLQAGQLAANLGMPIYAVDCGGELDDDATELQRQERQAGREVMQKLAELTGGAYFSADDPQALTQAYAEIDRLEQAPLSRPNYRQYIDTGHWFGLLAATVTLLSFALAGLTRPLPGALS